MCDRMLHAFERRILKDALDDSPNSLNRLGTWQLFGDIALKYGLYTGSDDTKKIDVALLLLRYLSSHAVLREAKRLREGARADLAALGIVIGSASVREQHENRRAKLQYAMLLGFDGLLQLILRRLSHMPSQARIEIIDRMVEKDLFGDTSVLIRHASAIRNALESREIPPDKVRRYFRQLEFYAGAEDICRAMEPEDADGNVLEEVMA